MMIYFFSFIFMYVCGLTSFSLNREHLLMMLLSLEFIVVSLYFGLYLYMSFYLNEYYFMLVFLTLGVCEGALGLSLLVLMMRFYGNDYTNSFSLLW
uniref:NADH-ubiquinone oxidoreductase chain 4L n=1 Tax=Figulus binodulus TaxID=273949 RepID=A0A5J6KKL1_9SCAR|nr:NADH dehydrogenase subunit 4L [Figulus binodulus]QEV84367.1 NADH dehydrogenase subunit 4L [Figulus binodulus]